MRSHCAGSVGILVSTLPPSTRTLNLANSLTARYGHRVTLLRYPSVAPESTVNAFVAALEVHVPSVFDLNSHPSRHY